MELPVNSFLQLHQSGHLDTKTHAQLYDDVNQLEKIKLAGHSKAGLEEAAKAFESIFLKMMLDSMRAAEDVWAKDNPFHSEEQTMFRDMLDSQLSQDLSGERGLGLADIIVRQLAPYVDDAVPEHAQELKRPLIRDATLIANRSSLMNSESVPRATASQSVAIASEIPSNLKVIEREALAHSPETFVDAIWPYAVKAGQNLGVDPKVLVAQAALETGWGQSLQQYSHGFNLFGIKAGSQWQGKVQSHRTTEFRDGVLSREQAQFRAYDSIEDSFEDYQSLMKTLYFPERPQQRRTPQAYVQGLVEGGYATDPDYAKKIMSIYNSPRLLVYEQQALEALNITRRSD